MALLECLSLFLARDSDISEESVSSVVLRDTSCYDMLKESNPELVCGEAGDEGRDI